VETNSQGLINDLHGIDKSVSVEIPELSLAPLGIVTLATKQFVALAQGSDAWVTKMFAISRKAIAAISCVKLMG
jgi:hypothetical protein